MKFSRKMQRLHEIQVSRSIKNETGPLPAIKGPKSDLTGGDGSEPKQSK